MKNSGKKKWQQANQTNQLKPKSKGKGGGKSNANDMDVEVLMECMEPRDLLTNAATNADKCWETRTNVEHDPTMPTND